jgi:hypothetical protein
MIAADDLERKLGWLEVAPTASERLTFEQREATVRLYRALLLVVDKRSLDAPLKERVLAVAREAAKLVPERLRCTSGDYATELFLLAELVLDVRL